MRAEFDLVASNQFGKDLCDICEQCRDGRYVGVDTPDLYFVICQACIELMGMVLHGREAAGYPHARGGTERAAARKQPSASLAAWREWYGGVGGDEWNKVPCIECELGRDCDQHKSQQACAAEIGDGSEEE